MKLKQNQNRVAMSYSGNVNNKMENYKEGDLKLMCLVSRTITNDNKGTAAFHRGHSCGLSAQHC